MGKVILNGVEYQGGGVSDVEVNGSSVVNAQGVAEITVPDELADLADDSTHRTVTDTEKSTWSAKVSDNPTFTEASTRANIASGESFATILGKIKKWFSDLASMFVSKTGDTMSGHLTIDRQNGTASTEGESALLLGNNIAVGTDKNSSGAIYLWKGDKYLVLRPATLNANKSIVIPNNSGTLALTSDIPDISTKVSKSGDTMTGILSVEAANSTPLRIKRTNSTGTCYLLFSNQNDSLGFFAVGNDKLPYFEPAGGSDVRIMLKTDTIDNSTKFNGLSMKAYSTSSGTSIQIKISGAIRTGFLKIIGDGNGSGVDFIIPIHNSSVGTPVGHWVVAPSPVYIAGTGMFAISITVTAWNTLWVITNYDFY